MTYTIPPDNRSAGQSGHIADHNDIADALTGIAAAALPLAGGTMTGFLVPAVVSLTFGSSIALNAALGNVFTVTLTSSDGTLAAPSNPADGQAIRVRVIQGTGGGYTLSYASVYDFGTAGAPTLSSTEGDGDELGFEYWASKTKWAFLGASLGL